MSVKRKTAVLISGNGSNLQALINAAAEDDAFPADIALVVSNKAKAFGLERAAKAGIATAVVPHKDFPDRAAFDAELSRTLRAAGIEFVCLAGFMRILTPGFTEEWSGRMLNIHPSLLPSFRGHNAHEQVLEASVAVTGCTVHVVTEDLDGGPILAQGVVPREANDDHDSLAGRVQRAEHLLFPFAVRAFLRDMTATPPPPPVAEQMLFGLNDRLVFTAKP